MKKRICIVMLLVLLCLTGCTRKYEADYTAEICKTVEEFKNRYGGDDLTLVMPCKLPDGSELSGIDVRTDSYVMARYRFGDNAASDYMCHVTPDAEYTIRNLVERNSGAYFEVEYDGRTLYYIPPDYVPEGMQLPEETVFPYSFAFEYEGLAITVSLPSVCTIDGEEHRFSLEEILPYTEVRPVR